MVERTKRVQEEYGAPPLALDHETSLLRNKQQSLLGASICIHHFIRTREESPRILFTWTMTTAAYNRHRPSSIFNTPHFVSRFIHKQWRQNLSDQTN